jgi:type I restriction enzyme R subunit
MFSKTLNEICVFGNDILFLVNGVTKLGKVKYRGRERHVESLRKFFVAVAEDFRVLMIKLADRLHNLKTLEFVKQEKQKRIALEALEVYAPLAHRLGIAKLKGEIEDAAFPFAYPKEYAKMKEILQNKTEASLEHLEKIKKELTHELQKHVGLTKLEEQTHFFEINEDTLAKIKEKDEDENVKVINLIKSIEKIAQRDSENLFLITMLERAEQIKDRYENRQVSTKEALLELQQIYEDELKIRFEQEKKGIDSFTFFLLTHLTEAKIPNAEKVALKIRDAFKANPNWKASSSSLRELRAQVYYAVLSEEDNLDKATQIADELFRLITKAYNL